VTELQRMREQMEQMEEERAQMVAEVEAQIESALASMADGIVDAEDGSVYSDEDAPRSESHLSDQPSRPQSRVSTHSTKSRGRSKSRQSRLRSFATDSTLADSYNEAVSSGQLERQTDTIQESNEEEAANLSPRKKRFSNSEIAQDGMAAVDAGISQKSDNIAQKVLEIQQKLETALASDQRTAEWKEKVAASQESETEKSDAIPVRAHPPKGTKLVNKVPIKKRGRSGTASSTQSRASATKPRTGSPALHPRSQVIKTGSDASSKRSSLETTRGVLIRSRRNSDAASSASDSPPTPTQLTPSTPALTPGGGTTDDESDFQSAYSNSPPRESFMNLSDGEDMSKGGRVSTQDYYTKPRERISSTATATARIRRLSNQNRF